MADFEHIQSIATVSMEHDLKGQLRLRIAGATEPLTVTCPSLSAAEELAGLIDGYCKLVNSGKESCWNRKGEGTRRGTRGPGANHAEVSCITEKSLLVLHKSGQAGGT